MKKIFVFAFAAIVLLASCAKEQVAPVAPENEGVTVLEVGLPSNPSTASALESKTYMGEADAQNHHKIYWSNGDAISVNKTSSEPLAGITEGSSSATFTFGSALSLPSRLQRRLKVSEKRRARLHGKRFHQAK